MAKAKKGDSLSCEVCGLVTVVDKACGCADTAEVLCCGKPMVVKKKVAKKAKPAAKKPAKKAKPAAKKPAKKAAKKAKPAKKAAKKPAPKK